MIKVLFAPLNYGDIIQDGVYDAFREAGCHLDVFDYFHEMRRCAQNKSVVRNNLIQQTLQINPDILHLQIQHTDIIDSQTISEIKRRNPRIKIVNWTGDARNYVPPTYKSIAHVADYNLISSTGQIDMFSNAIPNKKIMYWQIGYNPKLYYPENPKRENFEYDVVFVGNDNAKENYPGRNERLETIKSLRQHFGNRFGLFGSNWSPALGSKGNIEQRKVMSNCYYKSICCLSISHYNNISHYFSDRLLMCLASGRPTISLAFPKWESYFSNNCDLAIANSTNQIISKVEEFKKDLNFANYIGDSGAAKVFAEHTYLSRVRELLNIVGLT